MARGSRKSRYMAIVKRFRIKELQQYLEFLNLETRGKKPVLFDRVWKCLKNILYCYEELPVAIENKIRELNEQSKIPFKKRLQFIAPPLDIHNYPMFEEIQLMIPGQRFEFRNDQQITDFCLPLSIINQIKAGEQSDGTFKNEIQLRVWNYTTVEEWEEMYLCVEINGQPLPVHQPSPHIIYITSYCVLEEYSYNRIIISSPRPDTFENYAFSLSLVARISPPEIIAKNPLGEVYNTKDLGAMINEDLKKFSENPVMRTIAIVRCILTGSVRRSHTLYLSCHVTKKVIKVPTRSICCTHPEVFELETFLKDMQYLLQWKCPVCRKLVKYQDLVLDAFLKQCSYEGKTTFVFHKRRVDDKLFDSTCDEIACEEEVIIID